MIKEVEIYFNWSEINLLDDKIPINETFIEGETIVDAYSISNNEVKDYIKKREQLYKELEKFYNSKGLKIARKGFGSQDGEYIELDGKSILCLLDPSAIEIWKKSKDVEDFLYLYKNL